MRSQHGALEWQEGLQHRLQTFRIAASDCARSARIPRRSATFSKRQNSGSHRDSCGLSLQKAFMRSLTCATRAMAVRATAPSRRSRRIDVEQSEASAGRPAGTVVSRRAKGPARSTGVAGFRGRGVVRGRRGGMETAATGANRVSRSHRRSSRFRPSHRS